MDITRKGAERDRGTTRIISGLSFKTDGKHSWDNNVSWEPRLKELVICPKWVRHADGITHHNYEIRLNLDDISSLINLLGHAGSATDAELLRDHLGKHIPAIVKLLACATGVGLVSTANEALVAAGRK